MLRRAGSHALELVRAEPSGEGKIRVMAVPVDDRAIGELVSARMAALAERCRLTLRERAVFELLLLGRSHAQIGSVLKIGVRTVKFHQQNIQRKVGFESRLDLPRLLL